MITIRRTNKGRGFTLVELLVVISLITIFSTAVFTAVSNSRKTARDESRVADLEQIKLGLKLYKEANGVYPNYPDGITIGRGEAIDSELSPYVADLHSDPLNTGAYSYWYDSAYSCNGKIYTIVMARTMENSKNDNYSTVCGSVAYDDSKMDIITAFVPVAHAGSYTQGAYYSEATYYSEGSYYAEATYYGEGGYYSEGSYGTGAGTVTVGADETGGGSYIVIVAEAFAARSRVYREGSYYSEGTYYGQGAY